MISRIARGRRSLTVQRHYALPHTRMVSAGRMKAERRPVLVLVPGCCL